LKTLNIVIFALAVGALLGSHLRPSLLETAIVAVVLSIATQAMWTRKLKQAA